MEGKTIQQIKDEVALANRYKNFERFQDHIDSGQIYPSGVDDVYMEVMRRVCELQKRQCANDAKTIKTSNSGSYYDASVDKQSILTAKNVCDES